ncbi:S-adenosyl-L-methionine-dependent methyltransferase [Mycena epipterygia]|nr:S-adenosyl-L-methionine-dependent methyltransferase [Mycena epipterygia]
MLNPRFIATTSSMSVTSPPESRYPMPAISPEKERLSKLYAMKKSMYGWSGAVPNAVDLSQVESVIDIGAGTCIWTLDLVAMPEIKARREKMRIYVCDINTGFFPESMSELGITAFQQDVTKPFPEELYGTFDLVHASFLVGCLTPDGWSAALANYRNLLKPGGLVMLDETDTLFLPDSFEQDTALLEATDQDLDKHLSGNSWIHKANCVYTSYCLEKDFIVRITSCLRKMLENSGFRVEESKLGGMAMGPLCRSRVGVDGASLAEYEEFSLQNVELVLAHLAAHMLKSGTLEAPKGKKINGEAEMKAILKEIGDGIRKEGAFAYVSYFVAIKE